MADEKIRVQIESEYDDKEAKDAIKDAEKIEKLDPELQIEADATDATKKIEEVSTDAKALTKQDTELVIRAKIDAAKADLASLDRLHRRVAVDRIARRADDECADDEPACIDESAAKPLECRAAVGGRGSERVANGLYNGVQTL